MLYQLNYAHHIDLSAEKALARPKPFGTPEGTRTPGLLLRRQLLYPAELLARMERVMGIEPTRPAWKAGILPLNYTRMEPTGKCQPKYNSILPPCLSIPNFKFLKENDRSNKEKGWPPI